MFRNRKCCQTTIGDVSNKRYKKINSHLPRTKHQFTKHDNLVIEKSKRPLIEKKSIVTSNQFCDMYPYLCPLPLSEFEEFKNFNQDLLSNRREICDNFVNILINNLN